MVFRSTLLRSSRPNDRIVVLIPVTSPSWTSDVSENPYDPPRNAESLVGIQVAQKLCFWIGLCLLILTIVNSWFPGADFWPYVTCSLLFAVARLSSSRSYRIIATALMLLCIGQAIGSHFAGVKYR